MRTTIPITIDRRKARQRRQPKLLRDIRKLAAKHGPTTIVLAALDVWLSPTAEDIDLLAIEPRKVSQWLRMREWLQSILAVDAAALRSFSGLRKSAAVQEITGWYRNPEAWRKWPGTRPSDRDWQE